jgi:peptidyl-prolyl cis-trans isomerase D
MLQNIRDKLQGQKWLGYVVLGALALVFVAWGPYSAVSDIGLGGSDYAARVDGESLSRAEINDSWRRQQPQLQQAFGGTLTDAQRTEFQQRLLDTAVRGLAANQYARRVGYRVTEDQLTEALHSEQAFQIDGKFDAQAARSRLAAAGVTPEVYERDLRRDLLSNQLLATIAATDFLTPAESRRLLGLLDEERELRFLLLQPEAFAGTAAIDAAAIDAHYRSHAEEFTAPESVRLAYAELSLADIAAGVQVSEEQLRERYEQNKDSYVQSETRRARHILIAVDGQTDDAKAAALARDLHARIRGGADFAALARQHSKDSASAASGGELDWAGRDVYVPEFAEKLFTMKEGQTSEPVKTQYGYHIIRLEGVRGGTARTLEDMRVELTATLRSELAAERFGQREDALQERLERGGTSFDQVVQEFSLRAGEVAQFERGAGGLPLGSDVELNREVFGDAGLNQRRIGGPVQLGEDRLTIFQVREHRPAKLKPLEEVRDGIVDVLRRERGSAAALAAAEEALKRLEGGAGFDAVAASLKLKADAARFVARGAPDLPVAVRDAVFAAVRPQPGKPWRTALPVDDGVVALVEVTGSRVQSLSDNPQLQQLRTQRELQRYSRRDVEAYLAEVVRQAKVRRNPNAFQ